jgi:predicted ester cyclase
MPDWSMTCEDVIAEGDRVVCRVRVRGTQTGPLEMAVLPLPASGRQTTTEQIHIFRIAGDRVVEHWAGRDDIAMLRQLGHLPAVKPAATKVAS